MNDKPVERNEPEVGGEEDGEQGAERTKPVVAAMGRRELGADKFGIGFLSPTVL